MHETCLRFCCISWICVIIKLENFWGLTKKVFWQLEPLATYMSAAVCHNFTIGLCVVGCDGSLSLGTWSDGHSTGSVSGWSAWFRRWRCSERNTTATAVLDRDTFTGGRRAPVCKLTESELFDRMMETILSIVIVQMCCCVNCPAFSLILIWLL